MLPPPTWTTLKQLARFNTIADAFTWARTTRIVTIQPAFIRDEHTTMLTLPGDPTYPPIEGWDVPEDTRFLLRDGRWQPVPERSQEDQKIRKESSQEDQEDREE
jgi:hypothetical protein